MELGIKLSFEDQVDCFLKVLDLIGISSNLLGGVQVEFTFYKIIIFSQ